MDTTVKQIYSPDNTRRINIFQRTDGLFGFEEQRWSDDEFELCWVARRKNVSVCDSVQTAEREARSRADWLIST